MIGLHDSFKNKFFSFFYHKDVEIKKPKEIKDKKDRELYILLSKYFGTRNFVVIDGTFHSSQSGYTYPCRYFYFNNERVMMNVYMRYLKDNNPDIWHGFFIETFDIPYIINRSKSLNINYSYMSPLRTAYIAHGYAEIRGSIIYDIPKNYAHFMGSHRYANSLKKVAESHLTDKDGNKLSKTSDRIVDEDWYDNDWDRFIEYCLIDVELCVLLEDKLGLIEKADRFEKFSGVNPKFVLFDSHIIESLCSYLKVIYEEKILKNKYKIAFDTKKKGKPEKSAGAIVLPSKKGFYKSGLVIVLDLSKMYPEIIRSLNISVETLIKVVGETEKHLYNYCKENNVYYKKEPIGFIPFIFTFLFKLREEFEKERDKYEFGTIEYKEKNKPRQTVKDFVNAVTGQFDYDNSIILEPECANSYRLTGQKEIKIARDFSRKFSKEIGVRVEVLYGDTDSIFVWLKDIDNPEVAIKVGKEIVKWIHYGYDEYAKELNLDSHHFSMAMEKVLDVWVSIGKKKKYFGHVLWADGNYVKEENSLMIKGFESRRSDSSEFTDKVQKEIFTLINNTKNLGWEKVRRKIIYKLRQEYPSQFNEDNIFEIGIPKGLQKDFKDYKVTNPHLRGCDYANRYLGGNFGAGSKPKLIYIKGVKKNDLGLPPTNDLCIEDGMTIPKGIFIIDKEKMILKTVFAKLEKTLDVVGIRLDEILTKTRRKSLFEYIEDKKDDKGNKRKIITNDNLEEFIQLSKEKLELIKSGNKD